MGNCLSPTQSDSEEEEEYPHPAASPPPLTAPDTTPSSSRQPTRGRSLRYYTGKSRPSDVFAMRPLDALRSYATVHHPPHSLPPSTLLMSTPHTMAIFDAYPKAKYHFLVLPRYPFPPRSNPESRSSIVKLDHLDSLRTLLLKTTADVREQVIGALADTAQEVEEMIRDEMIKTEGFEWGINIGFHAIPSMKHVHVHVISEDRMSDKLKTKKHYNSFRPDLGFFVSLRDVQHWIEDGDDQSIRQHIESLDSAEALLDTPLMCFKCDEPEHNMPSLKKHLEKEYEKEKKTALKRIAERGRQRSSDEDMF